MWKETKPRNEFRQLDFLALTAIRELREHASGIAVTKRVSKICGRDVMSGTVYMALDRLERRGHVESFIVESTSPNSGPKRYFRLKSSGEKLLSELTQTAGRLADAAAEMQFRRWLR